MGLKARRIISHYHVSAGLDTRHGLIAESCVVAMAMAIHGPWYMVVHSGPWCMAVHGGHVRRKTNRKANSTWRMLLCAVITSRTHEMSHVCV